MSKEYMQVKAFVNCTSANEPEVNEFLKEIGARVVSVTPIWNTIMGGMEYVIIYWY